VRRPSKWLRKVAVFLDRDGVLVEELHACQRYLTRPEDVRLLPGVAAAVRKLNDAGLQSVVATNQASIAKGIISERELKLIHARLEELLFVDASARIDKIYFCPYHPEGTVAPYMQTSNCRKPETGMFVQAARELDLDLPRCFVVGDQESDMIAAKRIGCKGIAVLTEPFGVKWFEWVRGKPSFVATGLSAAVDWILRELKDEI
jgi:D-glycero-D-manno-heptose 1,7-bisphosphate phosphatase